MGKRRIKERFAAPFSVTRFAAQSPAGSETWIGKEVDILDIGNQGIKNSGGRFRTGKLHDNDVMNEIA
jgi:hypothetical protein